MVGGSLREEGGAVRPRRSNTLERPLSTPLRLQPQGVVLLVGLQPRPPTRRPPTPCPYDRD